MKHSIIAVAVLSSVFMSAGIFAAEVDTGTLTIKGNIAESPCTFVAGGDSVSINMPTVPTTVFDGKAKYSTYDGAVGVTSSMLKITCPKTIDGVKLSLITNEKILGNDKAISVVMTQLDTISIWEIAVTYWIFPHHLILKVIKLLMDNMQYRLRQNI